MSYWYVLYELVFDLLLHGKREKISIVWNYTYIFETHLIIDTQNVSKENMFKYEYWHPIDKKSLLIHIMTSVNKQQGILLDQFQPWSVTPYDAISYSKVDLQRLALIHGVVQEARFNSSFEKRLTKRIDAQAWQILAI